MALKKTFQGLQILKVNYVRGEWLGVSKFIPVNQKIDVGETKVKLYMKSIYENYI